MSALAIGGTGICIGLAAFALNIAAMGGGSPSLASRKRAVILWASVIGILVCPLTLFIGIEDFTTQAGLIEWPVLYYGWPFPMSSADRIHAPTGPEAIVGNVAFWLLAPQIVVFVDEQFQRRKN